MKLKPQPNTKSRTRIMLIGAALAAMCTGLASAQPSPRPEPSTPRKQPAKPRKSPVTQPDKTAQPNKQDSTAKPATDAKPKNEPPPLVDRPDRPIRTPVDLADRTACYRELADLASFTGHEGRREGGSQEPAVGWHPYPAPEVALDRIVRFDHLLTSTDAGVRQTAAKLMNIVFDNWALNRFEAQYGDTFESRSVDYGAQLRSHLGEIAATIIDYERPRTEMHTYYDSQGNRREMSLVRDTDYTLSENAKAAHASFVRDLKASSLKRRDVSAAANAARELLADELLTLWDAQITANLPPGKDATLPLEFVGRHFSGPEYVGYSMQDARDGRDGGALLCNDSYVRLTNTGADLHNVLATIEIQDEYGLKIRDQRFLQLVHGGKAFVYNAFGKHARWLGHTTDAKVTVHVRCDEGAWSTADQPFPPIGAASATVARFPAEARKQMRDQAIAADPALADAGKAMRQLAQETFAWPQNPDNATKALRAKLKAGDVYTAAFTDSGTVYTVQLTLASIDESTGLYLGNAVYKSDAWDTEDRQVRGRMVEEIERGAAVGFKNSEVKDDRKLFLAKEMRDLEKRLERLPEGAREAFRKQRQENFDKLQVSIDKRVADQAEAWKTGKVWLLASPVEIKQLDRDSRLPTSLMAGLMDLRSENTWGLIVQASKAEKAQCAELALFLSPKGQLIMQSSLNPEKRAISFCGAKASR